MSAKEAFDINAAAAVKEYGQLDPRCALWSAAVLLDC